MEKLNISDYKSVGEFYEDAKKQGYSVPLQICIGLSQLIKAKNLTFQEAYEFLLKNNKIILVGRTYIYDLSASKLWE